METANIRIRPAWLKSKEEIWVEKFEHLDDLPVKKGHIPDNSGVIRDNDFTDKKGLLRRIPVWSYAASLLIPILLVCHFYTVSEDVARGKQAIVQLPDRSMVTLNAESSLSYKPLMWFITRKVRLEGEAFFEVKRSSRFSVQSGSNRVTVLGTTFNVYSRSTLYRVTCLTGKVEVRAGDETAILNPNMQATFDGRTFNIKSDVSSSIATGWMQSMFVFDKTPLNEVIAEVERQYNIQVAKDYDTNHFYTGNFSKTEHSAEEILTIIGKAFGIVFHVSNMSIAK